MPQEFAHRYKEIMRRELTSEGKATGKFYILGKVRTTNRIYLVPVVFTVDIMGRTTEMAIDESRLHRGLMYV